MEMLPLCPCTFISPRLYKAMALIEQLLALPRAQRMRELGTLTPEQQVCLIHVHPHGVMITLFFFAKIFHV